MSVTVANLTPRIRALLKELDGRKPVGIVYLHQVLRDEYSEMEARMPANYTYSAAAGTIAAGADSFTLPTTSSAEYKGDIRVQLVSNGHWLDKITQDEMTLLRESQTSSNSGGIPTCFAPYEDTSQQITCWVYPRNQTAQSYNLFSTLMPADFGADIDATTLPLGREAATALVYKTAAALVHAMDEQDLADRHLSQQVAATWERKAETLIYQETARRFRIESVGRMQRLVP